MKARRREQMHSAPGGSLVFLLYDYFTAISDDER